MGDAAEMARGATIYKTRLEISLVDRNVYATAAPTVARHPSETHERTLARVLAYALCFEEDLDFGRGVSASDEPDVWSREGDGRPRRWIDVGQPDGKRIVKASRQAERVAVFPFGDGLARYRESQIAPLEPPSNLAVAAFEPAFLTDLGAKTDRQLRWSLTASDGILYVTSGDESFETRLDVWIGDPFA